MRGEHAGTGAVTEQDAGAPVLVVNDAAELLDTDDQDLVVGTGLDELLGAVRADNPAAAGCADVPAGGLVSTDVLGDRSGGLREFVPTVARAAVAAGADALFLEVHPDPDNAPCDGPNMWRMDMLEQLLREILALAETARAWRD